MASIDPLTYDVTRASASATASATAARTSRTDETQDRFLALLVSQLKNQDPLNPMANSEVTSQLAQINTVKGIESLNQTLKTLLGRVDASQGLSAAGLVGRRVMVPGNTMALAGGAAHGGFELAQPVDRLMITVKDAGGNVMHTADLGARAAGLHVFDWDGLTDGGVAAAPGSYRFEVTGFAAGKGASAETLAIARVDGVVPGQDGVTLALAGLPAVPYSQVRQILTGDQQ